jgi:hypothetical protein
MVVKDFVFIRPGAPTSPNPVEAFAQGMRSEPEDVPIDLIAQRCLQCGRVELFAT